MSFSSFKNSFPTSFPERNSAGGSGDRNFLESDGSLFRKSLLLDEETLRKVGYEGPTIDPENLEKEDDLGGQIFTPSQARDAKQCKFIFPEPGKCFKTKDMISSQKVFVNICHSDKVPEPPIYFSETQLQNLINADEDDSLDDVRIPMSIGAKRIDKDKDGLDCQSYDIIVNSNFFKEKVLPSKLYLTFVIIISMEALDEKHKVSLDKNKYVVMKHKACHGKLDPQFVRDKPNIREISSTTGEPTSAALAPATKGRKPLIEEIDSKTPVKKETTTPAKKIENESRIPKQPPRDPVVREVSTKVFKKAEDPVAALPALDMSLHRDPNSSKLGTATVKLLGMKRSDYANVIVNCKGDTLEVISVVGKSRMKAPINIISCTQDYDFATNILTLKLKLAPMTKKMIQDWKEHGHDLPEFETGK